MRDAFDIDHALAALERAEADPINKARALNRRDLPKRFYKAAAAVDAEGGFAIHLDGRPVKTPAKQPLLLPRRDLAEAVAAEWAGQGERIDPSLMPMTRLANSIADGVSARLAEVADDAAKYAATDLICYRAGGPDRLVARQATHWDPLVAWAASRFGAHLKVTTGLMHVAQDEAALGTIRAAVATLDAWQLGGLHQMTTIGGSLIAAVAVMEGRVTVEEGWQAVALDDLWSQEVWGADEEAEFRLARRKLDFEMAAMVARG